MFETSNPYTQQRLASYQYFQAPQIEACLQQSQASFQEWKNQSLSFRLQAILKVAAGLRGQREALALQISLEMGKPIREALSEIEKSAAAIEYLCEQIPIWLEPLKRSSAEIQKKPLGPILCVMPWNFPLWQVIRFSIPALAAGNTVLLKGADIVAGTSVLLTQIISEALGAFGLFLNLPLDHSSTLKLISDGRVRAVTFTGSTRGGRAIGAAAGAALKKSVLELGGSDPYILLDDCDVPRAARLCAESRLLNTGQSCIAAKRFFVPEHLKTEFLQAYIQFVDSRCVGDPIKPTTELGVLAHSRFLTGLTEQLAALQKQGNLASLWRSAIQGQGNFCPPEILESPLDYAPAHQQEIFAPVGLLFSYVKEDEMIRAANASPYGLGAAVFSRDMQRAAKIGNELESGMIAINDFIKSDPRLPFGGVKESGFGRELSEFGLLEFVNLRTATSLPG